MQNAMAGSSPQTSGTLSSVAATRLLSLRPAYLCRCDENSDSSPCAG
jgi:hypothetical protein